MSSIVIELQADCINKNTDVSTLLRKGMLIAHKLNLHDFESWIQKEMDGYPSTQDLPKYRAIKGEIKALNPVRGWIDVNFESPDHANRLSTRGVTQPISEIEHMLEKADLTNGIFHMLFSHETEQEFYQSTGHDMKPSLHVNASRVANILEGVRNTVLRWALQLEKDGILGESLRFTSQETASAKTANYNIQIFIGDVINSQLQQATIDSKQSGNQNE